MSDPLANLTVEFDELGPLDLQQTAGQLWRMWQRLTGEFHSRDSHEQFSMDSRLLYTLCEAVHLAHSLTNDLDHYRTTEFRRQVVAGEIGRPGARP